ncbi:zinc finger protein 862-like [Montipora foliosa]|uniref:zinc finger protein 862-like n=1 Tax=Montipora foliosa TaxID=591990 RepID=UPI0035F1738D
MTDQRGQKRKQLTLDLFCQGKRKPKETITSEDSSSSSALVSAGASTSEETVKVLPARQLEKPVYYSKAVSAEESTGLLNSLFKEEGEGVLHHQSLCSSKSCCKLSAQEQTAHKKLKDKFKHEWLFDKEISFCSDTGIWWLSYLEGKGMFCLLCRKHDAGSKFNRSKVFNLDGSVRFRKPTLIEHINSQQHRDAISAEHLQRVSTFHIEITEKENTAHDVLFKAFYSLYWLAKEEISNRKFTSLLSLLEHLGLEEMKYLNPRSPCAVREMFLVVGQVFSNSILQKLHNANFWGLLCDDVTDISVKEQFVCFAQFFDSECGVLHTDFLFVQNVLKDSDSANAETLFTLLTNKMAELNMEINKVSSLVSDGASVMLGSKTGLAARLKEVNSTIISIHCICHKLALACVDTAKDVEYIQAVEDLLGQLWKYLENSPKRMAIYLKVQQEVKSFDLSKKSRKVITKKLKKACQTRWLSLDHAVEGITDDLEALMRTLRILESDATACGLLKKIHRPKFVGCVYILKHILPVLSQLSKTFQRGCVNFSHISPAINHAKHKLQCIVDERLPLKQFKQDLEAEGKLETLELTPTEFQFQQQEQLLLRYVSSLKANIDQRFSSALPVLSAFAVFDVMMAPPPESVNFKEYGLKHIETLAKHFYNKSNLVGEVKKQQLQAEWGKFKFDLLEWKKVVPKDVVDGKCPTVTTTTWTLHYMQAFSQAAVQPSKGRPVLRNGRFSTACFGRPFTNFCA